MPFYVRASITAGSHNLGTLFLKPFVRDVLCMDISEFSLSNADVYSRYEGIDIALLVDGYFIPFEVKINDSIQSDSYSCYRKFITQRSLRSLTDRIKIMCFITPFADIEDLHTRKYISFRDDISNWILYCMKQPEIENNSKNYAILLQFREFIDDIIYRNTIDVDVILSSPESMKTAFNIGASLNYAIEELKQRVISTCKRKARQSDSYYIKIKDDGYIYVNSEKCRLRDGQAPNFKYPNEALFKLCNMFVFDTFTDDCAFKMRRFRDYA